MAKVKRGKLDRATASEGLDRLVVECVTPELDAGRYPVKRVIGDLCEIGADIFKDGHDLLAGHVRYRVPHDNGWRFTPLSYDKDADRWTATLPLDRIAVHFHDTQGTALANCTVALGKGVTTIDAAVGGLGGCPYAPGASGNLATEDLVAMLHAMGIETGVDLEKLVDCSRQVAAMVGHELPSKYLKAHLGKQARRRRLAER